jgi:hypothetical protein
MYDEIDQRFRDSEKSTIQKINSHKNDVLDVFENLDKEMTKMKEEISINNYKNMSSYRR